MITARLAGEIFLHLGYCFPSRSNTVMYIYAPLIGSPQTICAAPAL
jgi:hypothetical protein